MIALADTPRLIDLTRLVSRAGRGPLTGVDRVELAWLRHLLDGPAPAYALVRGAPGSALLDRPGMAALAERITGTRPWGATDLIARLHLRQSPARRQAMSDLRRLALPGCAMLRHSALGPALARRIGPGAIYLNIGHANLEPRMLGAVRAVAGARIVVLLHDTIPLDHPEFTRPGQDADFARKLETISALADRIIHISADSRARAEVHLARAGRVPPGVVAHLGVPRPQPRARELPAELRQSLAARPAFVTLGTVEPRKNHAFLLDLWERMAQEVPAAEMPLLIVAGASGWRNEAVIARLRTACAARPAHVIWAEGLTDGAVAALLDGARALLAPSLAEGFGLPLAEAAALGLPVIAHDLSVTREILVNYPVYADVRDAYSWHIEIMALARAHPPRRCQGADLSTWAGHFEMALRNL